MIGIVNWTKLSAPHLLNEQRYIFNRPKTIRDLCSHCWRNAKSLMNASEVVMHIMKANRVDVVLDFLGKSVGQSSEPPHAHAHGEVWAFNVACRDVLRVRVASTAEGLRPLYLRWAVPAGRMRSLAVELDELGVIHVGTKSRFDSLQIRPVSVAGDLHSASQPFRDITHKFNNCRAASIADAPGRDELRVGADCNPRPNIAGCPWRGLGEYDVALL